MISVEAVVESKYPHIKTKFPTPFYSFLVHCLEKLMHSQEINTFLAHHKTLSAEEFIEKVLEHLQVDYQVSARKKENIPTSGRVVIIANHPLGALDALCLIKLVLEVREDVKIVANDILQQFSSLKPLLIGLDNLQNKSSKCFVKEVTSALNRDEAVVLFPAGEVARASLWGIKESKWQSGFLHFSQKCQAPILPIHIHAKNSALFYAFSWFVKPLGMLLLPHEMFNKQGMVINFKVGELISEKVCNSVGLNNKTKSKLFYKHLQKVAKNKRGLFETQAAVAHPTKPKYLKQELAQSKLLGRTKDNKLIYLVEYEQSPYLMKELGRLREISFRKVGEGSGKRRDLDKYDKNYKHIVLWDEQDLELVGAYRIAEAALVLKKNPKGLYTQTLFAYHDEFLAYTHHGIELGRSFVQPRYWGSRALDYLWQGIGAYLAMHPKIEYMFGGVSLSASMSKRALELLVYFYSYYFPAQKHCVQAKTPFLISEETLLMCKNLFSHESYETDFRTLKEELSFYNASVPTLYKQYSELCELGGVQFLDFNIDADFENCVDGFILVDVKRVKESKRKRYIKKVD